MAKTRVLFGCAHNSARSQMAEALLRELGGDRFEAFSAGTEATAIRPETVTVMREIGISLAGQRSKAIGEFAGQRFDWYVTVCDDAKEACPVFPGTPKNAHWPIDDPARVTGSDEQRLDAFRGARDELRQRILTMIG
jgi:arsenate reductase